MKKLLISFIAAIALLGAISPANARGWHGGYRGGWAPFAVGAVAGAVIVSSYYHPRPVVYYGPPPQYYYPVQQQAAAYCPENGLYYPQTQACPSGWQRVVY
jgi:hypothetical protein